MLNSIVIVLAIVVVGVYAFSVAASNYYYTGVRTGLEAKAKTASEFFTTYVSRNYASYQQSAYLYTETFEDKNRIELQFINTRGRIEVSSFGRMSTGTAPGTMDIRDATDTGEISSWTGRNPDTGERVMAVSSPLVYAGQVVGVIRYVTSLRLVDRQVRNNTLIASAVGISVLLVVVLSNFLFLRTITEPIRELTITARNIAEGGYGAQTEKLYDDEIGELIDAINEMSLKISQAERIQTEFISSVSHELRTPLTAITGWSETLAFDEGLGDEARRGIDIIANEAGRLTKMVEELLEFTRMQDGRFTLALEPMDIVAELERSIYTYSELLTQENISLNYDPPDGEFPDIEGDPERLRQVFLNILDNAAKYGREGKRIDVSLNCYPEDDPEFVSITMRDYGPGIPLTELPHVKKMFYKGSSRERGSGIGLAVCDEIITRHKGSLLMRNAEGGGLEVIIRLPV